MVICCGPFITQKKSQVTPCRFYTQEHRIDRLSRFVHVKHNKHYRNQSLYRVSEPLGEALKTLGKLKVLPSVTLGKKGSANSASAKPSLPSAFSRALGKKVCRVPESTRQRKAAVTAPGDGDGGFAECPW
jgi:hypothetical protein